MKVLRPSTLSAPSSLLRQHLRASANPPHARSHLLQPSQQTRAFLPNPFGASSPASTPTKISISRTLPYPKDPLYSIISDISSYSAFVPFCVRSKVTAHSSPAPDGKKYPAKATLVVGWRDITESFDSRVYCVAGSVVEAVSGLSNTTLPDSEIPHYAEHVEDGGGKVDGALSGAGVFEHLVTRWTVRERRDEETDVKLDIEYQFSNPLYNFTSETVKNKIANVMIAAFEKRVREVLGHGSKGWGVEMEKEARPKHSGS